ncbi:hypothetical protein H4S02_004343 [Coemansia sp. RSA 2611]|nr:hypothetical protein H4S02_004343 [Coemansia sp. RSA 2611]
MTEVSSAQRARDALADTTVHDRRVRVDYSFTNRAHSPTPGRYKGQDTGSASYRDTHRRHFNDGYHDHRAPPYHPRRRANTRDRRRRDHPHRPHHSGPYSRSKSPGFHDSYKGDSYRRGSHYADSGRGRDYDGRRPNGYSRSPSRSHMHDQGYERNYSHQSGHSDDYRSNARVSY